MKYYLVEQKGDIEGLDTFKTLEDALLFIEKGIDPDPEDDRILIREVDPEAGTMRVVWHFSGWHWDMNEFDLPQGKLLGHDRSLYEEATSDSEVIQNWLVLVEVKAVRSDRAREIMEDAISRCIGDDNEFLSIQGIYKMDYSGIEEYGCQK